MEKAFDVILNTEVDAAVIAKSSNGAYGEKMRYKCLCCGEDVYLAAADSRERAPHFRHRRGNNDTDCEKYLGQLGAIEHLRSIRRHNQENIEFCFNRDRLTFEVGVSFGEEEITTAEEKELKFMVFTHSAKPILSVPISRETFIPNEKHYFTITELSVSYWVSYNSGVNRSLYVNAIIDSHDSISIFRARNQNDHSPQQVSGILYSNTEYYVISENEIIIRSIEALGDSLEVSDAFYFTTCGASFSGIKLVLVQLEPTVQKFFYQYNYHIASSESFSILWPPIYYKDSHYKCSGDKVYAYSSFPLIAHGNINIDNSEINVLGRNVHSIQLNRALVIQEKNIDMIIEKDMPVEYDADYQAPETLFADKFNVTDEYDFYLFDQNGCSQLMTGSKVYLSSMDKIVGYKNGHIKVRIFGCPSKEIDKQQLIEDIEKYHPMSETFYPDEFMDDYSDSIVISYLEKCYRVGSINTVIKRYIKEGLI